MRTALAAALVLFIVAFPSVARAQITSVTGDQAPPIPGAGHDYIQMLSETVNPANGAVSVRIGVPTPSGRMLSLPFSFGYDSNSAYHLDGTGTATGWTDSRSYLSTGGWSYTLPRVTMASEQYTYPENGGPPSTCNRFTDYIMTDLQGNAHALGLSIVQPPYYGSCQVPGPWNVNTLRGADAVVQATTTTWTFPNGPDSAAPVTVADMDGTVYYFAAPAHYLSWNTASVSAIPSWIEDRNGNKITFTDLNNGEFSVTDTAGRTVISSSGFGSTGNTLTVSGLANPYALTWGTVTPTVYPLAATYSHSTNPPPAGSCSTIDTGTTTNPEITAIELPNDKSYGFQYDAATGLLQKLTYPTGGYVRYVWAANPTSEIMTYPDSKGDLDCQAEYATEKVAQRYVSFDGTHEVLQQNFTYSTTWPAPQSSGLILTWQTKTTTITTDDLVRGTSFQTKYTYSPFGLPTPPNDPVIIGSSSTPVETQVVLYDTSGAVLKTEVKTYFDPQLPPTETDTLGSSQTSETQYTYASEGTCGVECLSRLTDKYDYDFGPGAPGSLLKHTHFDYASFATNPLGGTILDRPSDVITYNGTANRVAETDYTYDGTSVAAATATGHDEANFSASFNVRGNATTVTTQCFPSCPAPTTTYAYDETGQILSMKDPLQAVTQYSHTDSYTSGTPPGNTNAYLTKVTRPTTNGIAHISNYSYGYSDGQLTVAKDENAQSTTYAYNDNLDRLTTTTYPDGGQTNYSYNDATPSVTTSKLLTTSGPSVTSEVIYDGMGHPVTSELQTDPDGTDYTTTTYDGVGKPLKVYNPTRCNPPTTNCGESTWGYTSYTFDALGRTTQIVEPDNSSPVTTSYSGNTTTVTDQAGIQRKSQTDGLGRLQFVWEAPNSVNYPTSYTYDALGNLLTVAQNGSRPRTFVYDSLSRLTSSTNPETNTTSAGTSVPTTYTYDVNDNLKSKTMPAQNQTGAATVELSYCYDALNRVTSKAYTAQSCPMASPVTTYWYDGVTPSGCSPGLSSYGMATGRRTAMCDASGLEAWSYDSMGRVLTDLRDTNTFTYSTVYTYLPYVEGSISSITYPSGSVIAYTIGGAERQLTAVDTSHSITYASAVHYAPQGALSAITNQPASADTPLKSTYIYNSRLQPCWTYASSGTALATTASCTATDPGPGNVLDLQFNLNLGSTDNGNVTGITNNRDTTRSQSFAYDPLNRIATAQTTSTHSTSPAHCWGEAYVYDNNTTNPGEFGNLTNINVASTSYNGCTQESLSVTTSVQNRLTGYTYDTPGNLIAAPAPGTASYTYNAENQMTNATTTLGTGNYLYDGDGKRVAKSGITLYWYGTDGSVLDETNSAGSMTTSAGFAEYVYFGGKRIARRTFTSQGGNYSNVFYYFTDQLGTSRAIAEYPYAQTTPTVCYDADFYPFGGERAYINTCTQNYKFTGKERDSESNLDDFGARYDASALGRFMSPDWSASPEGVPYADLDYPQSLNLYAYVKNNPLTMTDPDGHCDIDGENHWGWCFWHKLGFYETQADRLREATNFFNNNDVRDANGDRIDPGNLSDKQILQYWKAYNDEWQAAGGGITADAVLSGFLTQWGWRGQADYNKAVAELNEINTPEGTADHPDLKGKVPTKEEALQMIKDAKGKVLRISEEGHAPGGVSTHTYPHINYETASGAKGTIRIKE